MLKNNEEEQVENSAIDVMDLADLIVNGSGKSVFECVASYVEKGCELGYV